jgi:hypothetical protein
MKISKSKLRQIIKECILAEIRRGRQGRSVRRQHPPELLIDPFNEIQNTIQSINLSAEDQNQEKEKVKNLVKKINQISIEQKDIRKYQNIMTEEFNKLIEPIIEEAKEKYKEAKEKRNAGNTYLRRYDVRGSQEYNYQDTPNEELINKTHQQMNAIVNEFNKYLNNEYNPKTKFFLELAKLFYEDTVWTTSPHLTSTNSGKPVGNYRFSGVPGVPRKRLTNPPKLAELKF